MSDRKSSDTLIVCLGNALIADDAVGYEVYQRLDDINARVEYLPEGGMDILSLLEGAHYLLVVDAVQFGYPPGTLHCIPWEDLPDDCSAITPHGLGVKEAIEIGRVLHPEIMPTEIVMVGIEGRCFDRPRHCMTPQVLASIDFAVSIVRGIVGGNR